MNKLKIIGKDSASVETAFKLPFGEKEAWILDLQDGRYLTIVAYSVSVGITKASTVKIEGKISLAKRGQYILAYGNGGHFKVPLRDIPIAGGRWLTCGEWSIRGGGCQDDNSEYTTVEGDFYILVEDKEED